MSTSKIEFVIYGEPCSKANQRRNVINKRTGNMMYIKSKKALDYAKAFKIQCPQINPPLEGDLKVTIKIYYASRRPDLDESLILDCMQSEVHRNKKTKVKTVIRNNIYLNDRQVKERHVYWAGVDSENPRAEIVVEEME